MIGGQVQSGFLVTPGVSPHVAFGKLVALAVSGKKRSGLLPLQKLLKDNDYGVVSDTPEQAASRLAAMAKCMAGLITKLGIKAD